MNITVTHAINTPFTSSFLSGAPTAMHWAGHRLAVLSTCPQSVPPVFPVVFMLMLSKVQVSVSLSAGYR